MLTDIAVRFSAREYQATEVSGAMEVAIILIRGISNEPVNVTVRLTSQSATGIKIIILSVCTCLLLL